MLDWRYRAAIKVGMGVLGVFLGLTAMHWMFTGDVGFTSSSPKVSSTFDISESLEAKADVSADVTDLSIDYPYGQVHAKVAGSPDSELLVLAIHGEDKGQDGTHWTKNLQTFAKLGRVVMMDMPGFGKTTEPSKSGSDPRCRKKAVLTMLEKEGFTSKGKGKKIILVAKGLNTKPALDAFRYESGDLQGQLAGMVLIGSAFELADRFTKPLLKYTDVLLYWAETDPLVSPTYSDKLLFEGWFVDVERYIVPGMISHNPEFDDPETFDKVLRTWLRMKKIVPTA